MKGENYTPTCCDSCKYCQLRFVKRAMDNSWRCRLMKYKDCYDATIKDFCVAQHLPTWCPLLKQKKTNREGV
ncbi:MAG: hypothetical protein FWB90_03960 [Fibromonadales bacterium]|nr:hypothetical protein [Fibromonadales bacterium]